uniref:Uncharacterized protein n=1 Tax=Nelumbo nucifera TaxID=4432 RepID=A0A822Z682_NELNU|nr:TPA_asm: hypothetical protein HUJ06_014453 [Nelumbo nucifera]
MLNPRDSSYTPISTVFCISFQIRKKETTNPILIYLLCIYHVLVEAIENSKFHCI